MGSFNVSCSISSLSIGYNCPTAFFFLTPNVYGKRPHLVMKAPFLLSPSDYFNPFALPIFGRYDDCGSLKDIKRDSNVKAIEDFLELPIDGALSVVVNSIRDPGFMDEFVLKNYTTSSDFTRFNHNTPLPKVLFALGFRKNDGVYRHPDWDYCVKTVGPKGFSIWHDGAILKESKSHEYNVWQSLIYYLKELTGVYFHIKPEFQKRLDILESLSGMFVHEEIYQALAESPVKSYGKCRSMIEEHVTEDQLKEFGFYKVPKDEQFVFGHNDTLYRMNGVPFDIKWSPYGLTIIHRKYKEYYNFGDQRWAKSVRDNWTRMGLELDTFPEPQNIEKVTAAEWDSICRKFQELMGASLTYAETDESDCQRYVYNLANFKEAWAKFTGQVLDIEKYKTKIKHQEDFEKLHKDLLEASKFEPVKKIGRYPSIDQQKRDYDRKEEMAKISVKIDGNEYIPSEFAPQPEGEEYEYLSSPPLMNKWLFKFGDFQREYEGWPFFEQIYQNPITEGHADLKEAFSNYHFFYRAMYGCSKMFFPTHKGEQCGNDPELNHLLMATKAIVDQRLREQEHDA